MSDEAHFDLRDTVNKHNFDTGQLQILMNFTTAPFMTHLPFDVLVGPEESLDPTSLSRKTNKPWSHHNVSQK
jgi:hypothetical protein